MFEQKVIFKQLKNMFMTLKFYQILFVMLSSFLFIFNVYVTEIHQMCWLTIISVFLI